MDQSGFSTKCKIKDKDSLIKGPVAYFSIQASLSVIIWPTAVILGSGILLGIAA